MHPVPVLVLPYSRMRNPSNLKPQVDDVQDTLGVVLHANDRNACCGSLLGVPISPRAPTAARLDAAAKLQAQPAAPAATWRQTV